MLGHNRWCSWCRCNLSSSDNSLWISVRGAHVSRTIFEWFVSGRKILCIDRHSACLGTSFCLIRRLLLIIAVTIFKFCQRARQELGGPLFLGLGLGLKRRQSITGPVRLVRKWNKREMVADSRLELRKLPYQGVHKIRGVGLTLSLHRRQSRFVLGHRCMLLHM